MTVFAHVTIHDTIHDPNIDQSAPRRGGINPAHVACWMPLANGGTRVYLTTGTRLDLREAPAVFEEACRTAGLVPA